MKKVLLFACAIAAMVSCAKTEVVDINLDDPNIISFSTYVGATRADVTSANIITGDGVGVFAVEYGTDLASDTDTPSFHIPNAMLSATGSYNDDANAGTSDSYSTPLDTQWSTSASYYWPVTNALDFYAYYPFVGTDGTAAITEGLLADTDYTEWPIEAIADNQNDYLAGIVENQTNTGSAVMLDLDHLLSKVDFQVGIKSEKYGAELEVTINSIQLDGIESQHQGLDLSVPELVPAENSVYDGTYTYSTSAEDIVLSPVLAYPIYDLVSASDEDSKTISDQYIFASVAQADDDITYSAENQTYTVDDEMINAGTFADGVTNTITSYATINSSATSGADSFKLLPQTLVQSDASTENSPFQRVTINYSIKQNGFDIVGNGDVKYKYTIVYFNNENDKTAATEALVAGEVPIYAALTNDADFGATVEFATDSETQAVTATLGATSTLIDNNYACYTANGDDAVTTEEIEAIEAALVTLISSNDLGIAGYKFEYAVDQDATFDAVETNNSVTFDLYTDGVKAWEPGCSYIYTIVFAGENNGLGGGTEGSIVVDLGATKIYFDVLVNEWASTTTDELEKEAEDEVVD